MKPKIFQIYNLNVFIHKFTNLFKIIYMIFFYSILIYILRVFVDLFYQHFIENNKIDFVFFNKIIEDKIIHLYIIYIKNKYITIYYIKSYITIVTLVVICNYFSKFYIIHDTRFI